MCKSCFPKNTSYSDNSGCVSCDHTTLGVGSGGDCVCPAGMVLIETNSIGKKLPFKSCQSCPFGTIVITKDIQIAGKSYRANPYSCQSCPDPLMSMQVSGTAITCTCPVGYTMTGVPSVGTQSCVPTSLISPYLSRVSTAIQVQYYTSGQPLLNSLVFEHYYAQAISVCSQIGDPSALPACQTLAHLCVLQLYDDSSLVCSQYRSLVASRSATFLVSNVQDWVEGVPWIYFDSSGPLGAKAVCNTPLTLQVAEKGFQLKYFLASYTLNGTFMGFQPLDTLFDYCRVPSPLSKYGSEGGGSSDWQLFGTTQQNTYHCNLQTLVYKEQLFFEMFLYDSVSKIYTPIPIRMKNLRSQGSLVNKPLRADRLCDVPDVLVRRFFLFDVVSGITSDSSSSSSSSSSNIPFILRYASQITLSVSLVPKQVTKIYTPILNIQYQEIETSTWPIANPSLLSSSSSNPSLLSSSSTLTLERKKDYFVSYSVGGQYFQRMDSYRQSLIGGFIAGCLIFGALLSVDIYNWNIRTSRAFQAFQAINRFQGGGGGGGGGGTALMNYPPQQLQQQQQQQQPYTFLGINFQTITELLLLTMKNWNQIFFPFFLLICWYEFVFFKLQSVPKILLPPDTGANYHSLSLYYPFVCMLYTLTFFQLTIVAALVIQQANADIFLVDWEPQKEDSQTSLKGEEGRGGGGGGGGVREGGVARSPSGSSNTVSVWRSILVANEWVKLQAMRRTDIRLTLFFMGFFLLGLDLQFDASQRPNLQDKSPQQLNPVLRFASTTFWWLFLSGVQYSWNYFIFERYISEPPEQLFLDICTLAKISLIILDEKFHGYYLHCRSPHQFADGSMMELIDMLRMEEAGLTVDRTLEGGPPNVQSFEIHLSAEWRMEFEKINAILVRSLEFMNQFDLPNRARTRIPNPPGTRMPASSSFPASSTSYPYSNGYSNPNEQLGQMISSISSTGLGIVDALHSTWNSRGGNLTQRTHAHTPLPEERVLRSWREMCIFLKEFIENNFAKQGLRRVVQEVSYLQQMFSLPPDLSALDQPSIFIPDRSGFKFCSMLFLGQESQLLLLNILSYSMFDLWFNSTAISILLCYLLDLLFCYLRKKYGQNVFSRKTLIDDRFILG